MEFIMPEKYLNITYRIMFVLAGMFLVLAILERIVNEFDYTLLWIRISSSRLLELSSILTLFVVALLLRQIRDILKK
jgi:hypothetical protein